MSARPPYKPRHARYTVKLSCDCLQLSYKVDGDLLCSRHGYRQIMGYYSKEWRARCVAPKCRFNQWCGQDEQGALRSANRHQGRLGHTVAVLYDKISSPVTVDVLRAQTVVSETPLQITVTESDRAKKPSAKIQAWLDSLDPDNPPF